ncbi:cysteine-rich KTR domain-containing protein [Longicatena caecimuris]
MYHWLLSPICNNKTRNKVRKDKIQLFSFGRRFYYVNYH